MTEQAAFEAPWRVEDLARACAVSPSFVRKCIAAGTLHVHRLGRVVRIAAPEARRFAADLGAVPLSPAHQAHEAHGEHPIALRLARRKAGA